MPCLTHPKSLLPIAVHNPALLSLVNSRITIEMVDYVARQAGKCVAVQHPQNASLILPPGISSLSRFIVRIVKQVHISTATLLACLIYFDRLRTKMSRMYQASETAMRRVFFATLIVASKYLNDSSPKNVHWAAYAVETYNLVDINLMERQLLHLLDFDLRFTEEEACFHFAPFMTSVASQASIRASALDKVAKAHEARSQSAQRQPSPFVPPPSYSSSSSSSSTFVFSVRGLAKRMSLAHIRADSTVSLASSSATSSPIPGALSSRSSTTSSSDMASLIGDSESSSGSSYGWTSSESESEYEEDNGVPSVYSATSPTSYGECRPIPQDLKSPRSKKSFILRPSVSYRPHQRLADDRSRKPSDTSSLRTITAPSPNTTSSIPTFYGRQSSKRAVSGSMAAMKDRSTLNTSITMPTFSRNAASSGFLSRIWGVAKGQTQGNDKSISPDTDFGSCNSLRRLVLVHSRSATPRTGRAFDV